MLPARYDDDDDIYIYIYIYMYIYKRVQTGSIMKLFTMTGMNNK